MNRTAWLQDRRDAEVSGCVEPLGARRAVDDGGGRTAGHVGAAVPTLSRSLRGGRAGGAARPAAGQAVAAAGAGAGVAAAAGSVPGLLSGLEREAFSRTSGARPQLAVGLHLGEDAVTRRGSGRSCQAARRAP